METFINVTRHQKQNKKRIHMREFGEREEIVQADIQQRLESGIGNLCRNRMLMKIQNKDKIMQHVQNCCSCDARRFEAATESGAF